MLYLYICVCIKSRMNPIYADILGDRVGIEKQSQGVGTQRVVMGIVLVGIIGSAYEFRFSKKIVCCRYLC